MKGVFFTDAHVTPDEDLSRFKALGKYLIATTPDLIVQGGDFGTFDTFSRWDRDKRLLIEGQRYKKDIDACREAISLIMAPIQEENDRRAKNKKAKWNPEWIWIYGNHEHWCDQYVERHPEIKGIINLTEDLGLDVLGNVTVVPYRDDVWWAERMGVFFCHGPRNRTGIISSKYIADKALEVFNGSVLFGHNHRLLSSSVCRTGSHTLQALSCGCFFEETPKYAVGHNNDYWAGIIEFKLLGDGMIDYRTISLEELKNG